jgi:hypothetical protein
MTRRSGQQGQRFDVSWPYDAEVAAIDGGDVGDPESLGGGDRRRVDGAEREIAVEGDQLSDAEPVPRGHGFDREDPRGKVAEKTDLGLDAESGREQIRDLGDDQNRDDQGTRMCFEQVE